MHYPLVSIQHGNIESKHGPNNKQVNNLSFLTRMSRVYWLKVCLRYLKLKQTVHYIVIIRKLFVSIILEGDKSFHLNGNNLLIADHPNNINQGGFCIYY